jgi:hypothetical protein
LSAQAAVLDHVPPGWDALVAADLSASPSHQPLVWDALAAAFPGFEWRLLVHHEDGALAAGAPVMLSRRGPFRWLHALPWLLPAAPIARAGGHARADAALARTFAELAREQRVVGGEWSFYRPGVAAPSSETLALVPGETRWFEAALLPLGHGLDACRAAMGRKQRQALDQARTRGLVFAEEAGALDEAYALHVAQSAHWPAHRPLPLELSRRLLAARAHGVPVARLFTLRSSRGLLSAVLALDGAHETFAWWSGTHLDGRRLHAFPLLLWQMAEWAAARGRLRLNLGASTGLDAVSSFKKSLGATLEGYPVRWLDARQASWGGRALAGLQAWRRRGRPRGAAVS